MRPITITRWLILALSLIPACAQHQVAITIDDLPRGGDARVTPAEDREMTIKLLSPFGQQHLPLTGFVNECHHADEVRALLHLWVSAGAELGNHTCSHLDLSSTPAADFEADLVKGEPITTDELGRPPRFFRYPYLHTGKTQRIKDQVKAFLEQRGYVIAPVTLDNDDYVFARVYADSLAKHQATASARILSTYINYMDSIFAFFERWGETVTGHDVKQILLIHASQLNADAMPRLLQMIRSRGYEIIPLGEALTDEAFRLPDEYVGPMGISEVHRWAMTQGKTVQWEPESPDWIKARYKELTAANP